MTRTFALLVLVVSVAVAGAAAAPRIAVDLPTYDFADTVEGIAVDHMFVLSNIGDQELLIESAIPTCHCTTTQLATNRLQPGQSIELRAVVDTNGLSGHVARSITVTSNDPLHPQTILTLAGNVIERQPYQTPVTYLFEDAYLLLDVREPEAYAAGHLLGAMNVPASQAVAFAAGFPPSVLVVFYDQSGTEATLAAVSQALSGGGLASAYALRGGLDLWQRTYNKTPLVVAGMDNSWGTFLDASGARAYVPSAALRTMDITQLRRRYYVLVDIRTPSAFATGHLAGATNISEAGVEAFVETLAQGVAVIIYSDDGSTSDGIANNLRVQGINAKSLLGGFAEWQKQHGSFLVVASAG